jgi:hypothetical protein
VGIACEVIGDKLQPVPGWQMVRDTTRPGRANLVAYVREDCELSRSWWIDHRTTWTRTEGPEPRGQHPARSSLVLAVGEAQVVGAHQVPLGTDHTPSGQLELVQALHLVMAPWKRPRVREAAPELQLEAMKARPRVLLWDDNSHGDLGLGSDYLGPKIGAQRHGDAIDNMLARHVPVEAVEYVRHAGGVELATDHPRGALVVTLPRGAVRWGAL